MALSAEERLRVCGRVAEEKKAQDSILLDLRGCSTITDFFFICSGQSERQVKTIADAIDEVLSQNGVHPVGREGYDEGRWVLLDYDEFIVHIFQPEIRKFYDLERLWGLAARHWVERAGAFMAAPQRRPATL